MPGTSRRPREGIPLTVGVFPGATFRPVSFGTGIMGQPLGWILHVAEGNGSPFGMFDNPAAGKVSTGWVAKDGRAEQYLPVTERPWAQMAGNSTYYAWETEGFHNEPLTGAQIETLAQIHIWHQTPDNVIDIPGGRGIGTHSMGGANYGGHACPGIVRAAQRSLIISTAQQIRAGAYVAISDQDAVKIADVVESRYQVHVPGSQTALVSRDDALAQVWALLVKQQTVIDAIVSALAPRP